ncbi:efflux transporter outer membrane subunit [Comamonas aquatica]|uniref:efflux transporter outer membrane subunit n=1 Tax=Comamonas aquatica TaxID=225991 RepID=UPI0024495CDE|nr:efflux transporter outer membrane subunit [Comamonas aquatica]MDH0370384.1 efflux transporter outer membrane subunit [Comamonas aquatica]
MQRFTTAGACAAVLAFTACTAPGADTAHWAPALPAQWQQAPQGGLSGVSRTWWRSLGSAELDALVAQAERDSWDVAAATARVHQAAASARLAGAPLLPELTAGVEARREDRLGGQASVSGSRYGGSLSASYELDFWGRNRSARAAAESAWRASAHDRDTVRLTVTAGVASAWLQAVALRERADIAQSNLRAAERLLQLVDARVRAGAASPLDLAQQRGLVATQQRSLALLQQQRAQAQTTVGMLLGQAQDAPIAARSVMALRPSALDAGLPAALLVRRPDVARAEAQLAAAHADVAAARTALLPRVTLTASLGSGDDRWHRLFDNPLYTLAAGLVAPVFDAGRLAAGHERAQARQAELLATYRQTIVQAAGEVQTSLHTLAGVDAQIQAQGQELEQAQRALVLAEVRYRAGAESLLVLLETQRVLYAAQDQSVQLQLERLQGHVALYKALGGGWSSEVLTDVPPS